MKDTKQYSFFSHKDCEYFPCHAGIAEEEFNCLFCYCPRYPLGTTCGGNFVIAENGIKDCSGCNFPHHRENYDAVTGEVFSQIVALFPENNEEKT